MSNNADDDTAYSRNRPKLTLDRPNRKLLGVCSGFARYLDVPPVLVRVIYCVACLASPFLILAYFVMYWLLEDEERPARIKAALAGFSGSNPMRGFSTDNKKAAQNMNAGTARPENSAPGRRFDLRKPLYRSRTNVRVAGVCAGIADYLGVSAFIVRALTLASLFILGGVSLWAYIIFWIVLDKTPKGRKAKGKRSGKYQDQDSAMDGAEGYSEFSAEFNESNIDLDIEKCTKALQATEQRLREVEAYITSKQFRLHCEINRI